MSKTAPCACCCPDKKACYQRWQTTWTGTSYTAPTSVQKKCLQAGADTIYGDWTKISEVAGVCTYQIDVPMSKCCTADITCTALADTATPAVPAGFPTDCGCFPCANAWSLVFDPACATSEFNDAFDLTPSLPGYVRGLTDPTTYFKTITYHGCDGEGPSTCSWTLDETTCIWVPDGNRVPDMIHNCPCVIASNTQWGACTGPQSEPCTSDSGDELTLSNPVTCASEHFQTASTPIAVQKASVKVTPKDPHDQSKWPLLARSAAKLAKPDEIGVGDTVQRLAAFVGGEQFKALVPNCGCSDRRQWLNQRFPYQKK